LHKVPFLNADSVSTINLSKRFEAMEQRMLLFEQTLVSMQDTVREVKGGGLTSDSRSDAVLDRVEDGADDEIMDNSWSQVVSRKSRRLHRQGESPHNVVPVNSSTAQHDRKQLSLKKKQKVFGNNVGADNSATLKAGVKIVQKSVVHIDNLSPDYTEALLKDYLLSQEIPVISCYTAKNPGSAVKNVSTSLLFESVCRQNVVTFCLIHSYGHRVSSSEIGNSNVPVLNKVTMADEHWLSLVTYNLHRLNQGYSCLASLCMDFDTVFIQEH